jgi:hypothetical protein
MAAATRLGVSVRTLCRASMGLRGGLPAFALLLEELYGGIA